MTGLAAAWSVAGCGADRDYGGVGTASAPTSAPTSTVAVQFRVVRTTGDSPADSRELQAFDQVDCVHPDPAPAAAKVLTACGADGTKYLLQPAVDVGGVVTATTEPKYADPGGYVVDVVLDAEVNADLRRLAGRPDGSRTEVALVVDGRVVAAPEIGHAMTGGRLELDGVGSRTDGALTQSEAAGIADRLDP